MGSEKKAKFNPAPVLRAIAQAQAKIDEGIDLFVPFKDIHKRVSDAAHDVGRAASGSYLGYQSTVYIDGLRPIKPGEIFDAEWGDMPSFSTRTRGPWRSFEYEEIEAEVLTRAGVPRQAWTNFHATKEQAVRLFEAARAFAHPALQASEEITGSAWLAAQAAEIRDLKCGYTAHEMATTTRQPTVHSRDVRAANGGMRVPLHLLIEANAIATYSRLTHLEELQTRLQAVANYLSALGSFQTSDEEESMSNVDKKKVFVVHGRNEPAREAVFAFLRALHLQPVEWEHALKGTGSASPFNWEVVENGFKDAQAFVILFTGDDWAQLSSDLGTDAGGYQPRPNVLIEAGMALQMGRGRTVIVQFGVTRPASDLDGMQELRYSGDDAAFRKKFCNRLRTAGCDVDETGTDWLKAGDFKSLAKPSVPPPTLGNPSRAAISSGIERLRKVRDEAFAIRYDDRTTLDRVWVMTETLSRMLFPADAGERFSALATIRFDPSFGVSEREWSDGCAALGNRMEGWLLELER